MGNKGVIARLFLTSLVVLIVLALVFSAGCQPKAPAPAAPAPAPGSPAPAAPAPAQTYAPVELNFATWQPPGHVNNTQVFEPFTREVAEKTEGRVKIYLHPGGALAKGDETYDGVVTGILDIGFALQAYTPGRFPLTTIMEFPFLFSNSLQACLATMELYQTNQAFQDEYKDVKVFWIGATDTAALLSTKPVKTMEDMKGLRIRTPGTIQNDVVTAFGGIPVSMPYADVYDALQRGVVDATFGPFTSILPFKLHEVIDHVLMVDFYVTPLYVVMNKEKWNKISPQDQAIIEELVAQFPRQIGELYNHEVEVNLKVVKDNNITLNTMTPEQIAEAKKVLEPLQAKWLADMKAKGLPAEEVYAQFKRLAEKYK